MKLYGYSLLSSAGCFSSDTHCHSFLFHLGNHFEHFLAPVFETPITLKVSHGSQSLEWGLMILSIAIASGGLLFARHLYIANPTLPEELSIRFKRTYTTLLNKYWIIG